MLIFLIVLALAILVIVAGIWAALPLLGNMTPFLFPADKSERRLGRLFWNVIFIVVGVAVVAALIIIRLQAGR